MPRINLNTATGDVLAELPGIGAEMAVRIVEYRDRVGRFDTVDELAAIPGITRRVIARFRDRVAVEDVNDTVKPDLPPLQVQVSLKDPGNGNYTGHRLTASFTRLEWIESTDEAQTSIWVPAQISVDLPPSGSIALTLPNRANLRDEVTFRVFAPDGELLDTTAIPADRLQEKVELRVKPKAYPQIEPNDDPSFGKPTRLKGRAIDESGRTQISDVQVVIWGAQKDAPAPADFRALVVVQTDARGYFAGPYPKGQYSAAYGTVAVGDKPVEVPIRLQEDKTFPESVILVLEVDGARTATDNCECEKKADAPRDPDMADLSRADGTYSSDPGAGKCVDFTKPDRTLEEFSYSYVVRTTEPVIKGLTLAEPAKIDIGRLAGLLTKRARLARAGGSNLIDVRGDAEEGIATDRIDAKLLQTLGRDPDGFSLTNVAVAATMTVDGDIMRIIAQHLGKMPGRGQLSCDNPVDWDDEPTIYQACTVAHGHVLRFKQEWVADGYSMGNLLYSLPLAPGQKKQIAVVDWERREIASRTEVVEAREQLEAAISRDRDINEVVRGTVTESVRGGSSASSSSFAAGLGIGAIIGPVGGLLGIGGGSSNANSNAWQNSSRGMATSALNQLRDRTIQSASSVRSQRSTVVQGVTQGERVVATTESVANYNHCHAITIQYFEVLRHLLVRQRIADVQECLFVPLLMSRFTSVKALRWRSTLQPVVANRRVRGGFDSLERIKNNYVGSDFPVGTYADQLLDHLEGDLYFRFELARPKDQNDDFDPNAWDFLSKLFPSISPADFYKQYLKGQALKDRIFLQELAPKIAERFVQQLQFFAINQADVATKLPVDTTLVSDFVSDRPLYVSARLSGALPPVARKDIKYIHISDISGVLNVPLLQILPTGSKVIVEWGSMRYRTKYSSDFLFRDSRIANDLVGGDPVRIFTPLNREELRNPREEDKELARQLLAHLNEHIEHYHHAIWWRTSPDRRYMLLDGFEAPNSGGRSVASVVENELIGIVGNSLIMPVARGFHLDPTFRQDAEEPIDLIEHYQPNTPMEPMRVAIPTRGVYAEAVMGVCNSCEMKEEQRFWRWEESPIPDSPSAILPVSTETRRAEPPDLTAKDFPQPIVNVQNAPAAPDPTGLAAALQLLGTPNLFKDITGLEGNQRNAAAALQGAFDTAQFFGGKAADLALQGKMSRDIDKAMRTIQAAKESGLITEPQAQELSKSAISGMIGGGTQAPKEPMTTKEVQQLTKTAGANDASVSVSRPGENVTIDAKATASLKKPLEERSGFFGPDVVIEDADLRDGIRLVGESEHADWFDAAGQALLESSNAQFGQLLFYWLASAGAIRPTTLTAAQAVAISAGINYGQLLNNAATPAVINAEAARVRADLLAGAPDTGGPANLNALVEQAIRGAVMSHRDDPIAGPWSAVFVVSCVRRTAIQLGVEGMSGGQHVGRDGLLLAASAHRVYVREAFLRRFGPNRKDGTYHAFRPDTRSPQVGDIIAQDRQVPENGGNVNNILRFEAIPAQLAGGFALHCDIIIDASAPDYVITVGGNLGNGARRRRYPLDANGRLVVDRTQLYTQEDGNGNLAGLPAPAVKPAPQVDSTSTARIFALLSLVPFDAVIPGQEVEGGVLV